LGVLAVAAVDHRYQDRASLAPLVCRRAGKRREGNPRAGFSRVANAAVNILFRIAPLHKIN